MAESTNKRIESHKAPVYRTTHYTQEQITWLKQKATNQARTIARVYFYAYPDGLSPSQVHIAIKQMAKTSGDNSMLNWPRTSIRARITGLTNAGILVQTSDTTRSDRGATEHKWKWKAPRQEPQQADMFEAPAAPSSAGPYAEGRL